MRLAGAGAGAAVGGDVAGAAVSSPLVTVGASVTPAIGAADGADDPPMEGAMVGTGLIVADELEGALVLEGAKLGAVELEIVGTAVDSPSLTTSAAKELVIVGKKHAKQRA